MSNVNYNESIKRQLCDIIRYCKHSKVLVNPGSESEVADMRWIRINGKFITV